MTHLGGALSGCVPWTSREDAIFAAAYSQGGIAAAAAALPGRSENALKHRAGKLGLQRRRRWTATDDQTLRDG